MTHREIIRNNLNKSDWEITKDKCDSTRAHRRHLAANGKHENKRKIYCTNVHLRIIEILITLMYNLSAVTAAYIQGRKGDDGRHKACPPPLQRDRCRASCLRRACVVPATCVQRRDDDKASPPTHTPPPPQASGMKVGRGGQRPPPPPPRTKRQGGEAAERACGTDRRKHAPCKPQRGGHPGWERSVGRATTGATRQPPPPCRGTSAAPRACAVLAMCLRQRTDSEDAPPPFSSTHPRKGQGQRGDSEGQRTDRNAGGRDEWRAVEVKKKTKDTNAPEQGHTAGADGTRQEPGSTARGAGKGNTPGEESWEAGTNTAANGGGPG